jgi:hypothetical protein
MTRGSPGGQPSGVAAAREVPVPEPFTLESFRAALERWRGRPLVLAAVPLPQGWRALWVGTSGGDFILYDPSLPPGLRLEGIAHQAGHMCAGHRGSAVAGEPGAGLFPGLDRAVVAAELPSPAAFTAAEEQEADAFTAALIARIAMAETPGDAPDLS